MQGLGEGLQGSWRKAGHSNMRGERAGVESDKATSGFSSFKRLDDNWDNIQSRYI